MKDNEPVYGVDGCSTSTSSSLNTTGMMLYPASLSMVAEEFAVAFLAVRVGMNMIDSGFGVFWVVTCNKRRHREEQRRLRW